jgi:hypothetical protein
VSPDVSVSQRRRLEEGGWELVEFRSGKSLWRRPEGGRLYTLKSALKQVNRQERGNSKLPAGKPSKARGRRTGAGQIADTSTRNRRQ